MKIRIHILKCVTGAVLLLGIGLCFNGCMNDSPVSVSNRQPQTTTANTVQTDVGPMRILQVTSEEAASLSKKGKRKGRGWRDRLYLTEKFIRADEGGTLIVGHPVHTGKSKIFFEPGDLSEDMTIRFEWRASTTLEGTLSGAKFGPHGTQFNNPVRVELSYKLADLTGVDEQNLKVIYFNEEEQLWEMVGGTVDTQRKVVIAYLDHFSRYAIAAE